jgi:hypothetical protein
MEALEESALKVSDETRRYREYLLHKPQRMGTRRYFE